MWFDYICIFQSFLLGNWKNTPESLNAFKAFFFNFSIANCIDHTHTKVLKQFLEPLFCSCSSSSVKLGWWSYTTRAWEPSWLVVAVRRPINKKGPSSSFPEKPINRQQFSWQMLASGKQNYQTLIKRHLLRIAVLCGHKRHQQIRLLSEASGGP